VSSPIERIKGRRDPADSVPAQAAAPSLTPSELNRQVRGLLESHFDFVWVSGEVSNFAAPSSGHWYFSIKDDRAQVRCAMFKGRNQRLRYRPQNGDAVRLRARVSLYEGRGEFQLLGEFIEPAGAGALQARFEALRDRLREEGLFDAAAKRPVPRQPAHLAVITSPTGAALQDILAVLKRRNPLLRISVLPAAVQGEDAPAQLIAALERSNRLAAEGSGFDVILLARGGGSLEDLWAFNDEGLARAIRNSRLPVVSAVGHEVDVTIADFAADLRAPTPSAAAELLSTDLTEVLAALLQKRRRLQELMQWRLLRTRRELEHLAQRLRHPGTRLREQSQRLDELELRLLEAMQRRLRAARHRQELLQLRLRALSPAAAIAALQRDVQDQRRRMTGAVAARLASERRRLEEKQATLRALSPLAILERGYAILSDDHGAIVRDASAVEPGAALQARLARGRLALEVKDVEPAAPRPAKDSGEVP
jgi:exodeoxyribonuclease VII large subunit